MDTEKESSGGEFRWHHRETAEGDWGNRASAGGLCFATWGAAKILGLCYLGPSGRLTGR
jgi:hypothetical protein